MKNEEYKKFPQKNHKKSHLKMKCIHKRVALIVTLIALNNQSMNYLFEMSSVFESSLRVDSTAPFFPAFKIFSCVTEAFEER